MLFIPYQYKRGMTDNTYFGRRRQRQLFVLSSHYLHHQNNVDPVTTTVTFREVVGSIDSATSLEDTSAQYDRENNFKVYVVEMVSYVTQLILSWSIHCIIVA